MFIGLISNVILEYKIQLQIFLMKWKKTTVLQLMNESEADVMRLTEQVKILKEEIRRLERNTERERETQNLEYLKNILIKVLLIYGE